MDFAHFFFIAVVSLISFFLSLIGASMGLVLGHLRLPFIVYILDSPIHAALTNLVISGFGALGGVVQHYQSKRISFKVVFLMGLPSLIGVFFAAWFFIHIPRFWGYLTIGAMQIYSGLNLVFGRPIDAQERHLSPGLLYFSECFIGLILGMLSAITGLMQGSIRLPLMIKVLKVDPKMAIGSNMAIGCLTAFAGALSSWSLLPGINHLALYTIAIIVPPTVFGGYLGAKITHMFSPKQLTCVLGILIACMGGLMIIQGFWSFTTDIGFQWTD